jgi:hypothetical protein
MVNLKALLLSALLFNFAAASARNQVIGCILKMEKTCTTTSDTEPAKTYSITVRGIKYMASRTFLSKSKKYTAEYSIK